MKQISKIGDVNKMKKISVFLILLAAVFLLLFITGCAEDSGMSIDDRIEAFVSDLNDSNRDGIFKEHFHSSSSSYSNGDEEAIVASFPNGTGYTVESNTGTGSTRTVTIKSDPYTFTMEEDGDDDWYIKSITGSGANYL